MSETASISATIATRYASALFDLSKDAGDLSKLEADTDALAGALDGSPELGAMITSPVYTRDEQGAAIVKVAEGLGLSELLSNTLALMASNRRLFALPALVAQLRQMIADEKGEETAEVTSAIALSDAQVAKLGETLKARFGKEMKLNTTVDESLIGGLIVKVGSKMIDTSVRAKLASLQNAMKEVG